MQLSDTHVGFNGPPDPLGTQAFENAVATINGLKNRPELIIVTGDLTHDADSPDEHAKRFKLFKQISSKIGGAQIKVVPGENDAALDGGDMFREFMGPTHYSFDHRGVHFIALDNVSAGRPEVGAEQLAWMKSDLARFPKTAPIIVFTHRPLFDLKPEWEWFTSDGDDVMNALAPYENVTVLYGHIHRENFHQAGHHQNVRGPLADLRVPGSCDDVPRKSRRPSTRRQPFKDLGIRRVNGNATATICRSRKSSWRRQSSRARSEWIRCSNTETTTQRTSKENENDNYQQNRRHDSARGCVRDRGSRSSPAMTKLTRAATIRK